MKKVLSIMAIAMLALTMIAGCGKKENDNSLVIGYTIYEPMNFED